MHLELKSSILIVHVLMWRWKHKAMLLLHVIFDGLAINCLHNLSWFPTIYICVKCVMWLLLWQSFCLSPLTTGQCRKCIVLRYSSSYVSISASEIRSIWGMNVMMILRYGRYNCMMFGIEVRNCELLITLKSAFSDYLYCHCFVLAGQWRLRIMSLSSLCRSHIGCEGVSTLLKECEKLEELK